MILYVLIKIEVTPSGENMSPEEIMEDVNNNCMYDLPGTDNVTISNTELRDIYTTMPC